MPIFLNAELGISGISFIDINTEFGVVFTKVLNDANFNTLEQI